MGEDSWLEEAYELRTHSEEEEAEEEEAEESLCGGCGKPHNEDWGQYCPRCS